MVGLTILFIIFVLSISVPIWLHVEQRNKINALAVGQRFVSTFRKADPWADDESVYTILELKNGWVKYKLGNIPLGAESAKDFVSWKVKISD